MSNEKSADGMNRRDFIKLGMIGTSATLAGLRGAPEVFGTDSPSSSATPVPVHRTLGRTGLRITVVSFGAMLTPEAEVIRAGLDMGINYVDTARRYMDGKNEEIVGRALKGIRNKVYLATKTLPSSNTREHITRDVETSLKMLQTDYIDVIQLHNLEGKERIFIPEVREALVRLREQGKVRFFGVTTHKNQSEVIKAVIEDPQKFFDTVLVAYNFKCEPETKDAIAKAAQAGVGVFAMKTQAGGYQTDALGPISPHQAALKWALQNPNVTAAIPGMKDLAMLKEDIAVMGMKFTALDSFILRRYGAAIEPYYCRFCGRCEPTCPFGVEISTINRSIMYHEGYGDRGLARTTYAELRPAVSAAACLDCPSCTARCVNGLDVASKMGQARRIFA
jgi:hypothetical protein